MSRPLLAVCWVLLGAALIGIAHVTGPDIRLSVLFPLPVGLATWFSGKWVGGTLALALPTSRLAMLQLLHAPGALDVDAGVNAAVAIAALLLVVAVVELRRRQDAMRRELRVLQGLLPICSFCKKIRNDRKVWEPIETYVASRSEADFTHSVCSACAKQHYGVDVQDG